MPKLENFSLSLSNSSSTALSVFVLVMVKVMIAMIKISASRVATVETILLPSSTSHVTTNLPCSIATTPTLQVLRVMTRPTVSTRHPRPLTLPSKNIKYYPPFLRKNVVKKSSLQFNISLLPSLLRPTTGIFTPTLVESSMQKTAMKKMMITTQ